jgi:hypothetical protein
MNLVSVNSILDKPRGTDPQSVFVYGRLACEFERIALTHSPPDEARSRHREDWAPFGDREYIGSSIWINLGRRPGAFEQLELYRGKNIIINGTVKSVDWVIPKFVLKASKLFPPIAKLIFLEPYSQLGHFGAYRAAIDMDSVYDFETQKELLNFSPAKEA